MCRPAIVTNKVNCDVIIIQKRFNVSDKAQNDAANNIGY